MAEAGDRVARLRKLAGVMLGTAVRGVELRSSGGPYPAGRPDLFLARLPGGRPHLPELDGKLRLRVLTHGWRLESPERVLAASGDPPGTLASAVGVLAGRAVSRLRIDSPGLDTTIWFGDLSLRSFPVSARPLPEGFPAWTLRTALGVSLVVGPGGNWGMSRPRPKDQEDQKDQEAVFDFDGIRLLVFPVNSGARSTSRKSGYTQWSLWRPQGDIVSVSPGSGEAWTVEPSKPRAAKRDTPGGPGR